MSHQFVDLADHLNGYGATYDSTRREGRLNAWGNSFPAEEIPFNRNVVVSEIPFRLPRKEPHGHDHVEALGQTLILPQPSLARHIGLLCCGEMGDQELCVELCVQQGRKHLVWMGARGWLIRGDGSVEGDALAGSHLHYVGDYELSHLRPVLWSAHADLGSCVSISALQLQSNPLFHIFAITLLVGSENDHAPV